MKTENQQTNLSAFLRSIGVPGWLSDLSLYDFFRLCIILFTSLLAGVGAFTFGAILYLPWAIIQLFDKQTLLYLSGDLSLILLVGFLCFKLSRLVIIGLHFQWLFIVTTFFLSRRYDHPVITRFHDMKKRTFIENRKSRILLGQSFLTGLLLAFAFLRPPSDSVTIPLIQYFVVMLIPMLVVFAILGVLSAYKVGTKITFKEFFLSAKGRPFAVTMLLLVFVVLGVFRTWSKTEQIPLIYPTDKGTCNLSLMFPVQNGHLFYDQKSHSYVVLGNGGQNLYLQPYSHLAAPECFAHS